MPNWMPWWNEAETSLLLETGKAGRYTLLIPQVHTLVEGKEDGLRVFSPTEAKPLEQFSGHPLKALRQWMAARRSPKHPALPVFHGGIVGIISYDFVRFLEKLPSLSRADIDFPLFLFGLADEGYLYDHAESILHCFSLFEQKSRMADSNLRKVFREKEDKLRRLKAEWDANVNASNEPLPQRSIPPRAETPNPAASFSRDEFVRAVRIIQEYIAKGDSYQVNLSIRRSRPLRTSPENVYEHLRAINPSPHMALLRFPGRALVCGSPELLVRLRDGVLEARPIAGTRPRGGSDGEDTSLTRELLLNEKERAEHLMLVDLIRNDLGRVSRYGSVRVSEFMSVERYSHVIHIVSHITGELTSGKDTFDAIAATFPGGTITGAPKVRTMEIIEELEPYRRGPYTGSIGWLGFDGNMELNIVIRTMQIEDGIAFVQAGAGIVADSVPEKEYEESLNKAQALWAAAARAETETEERV